VLYIDCWHCLHQIPSREWVVSASCARFRLLTLPASNPIQGVSREHLLCSISIADIACIKSHPDSESRAPPVLDFDCWHCLHQIPSSWWVVSASCVDFDCWHCLHQIPSRKWVVCTFCAQSLTYCSIYYLVCKYFSPSFSSYSFNRPAFHRHIMLKTLFALNSM